jgi:hypothetical protein
MTNIATEELATAVEHERTFTAMVDEKMLAAARGIIDATLEHAGLDREAIAAARAELVARAERQSAPVYIGPEPDEIVVSEDGTRLGLFFDADPIKAARASLGANAKLAHMQAFSDGIVVFQFNGSSNQTTSVTLMVTAGTIKWLEQVSEVVDLSKANGKYTLSAKNKARQTIYIPMEEI